MPSSQYKNGSSSQGIILIKGGRVVNDDCITEADVLIEDGLISYVTIMKIFGSIIMQLIGKVLFPAEKSNQTSKYPLGKM